MQSKLKDNKVSIEEEISRKELRVKKQMGQYVLFQNRIANTYRQIPIEDWISNMLFRNLVSTALEYVS